MKPLSEPARAVIELCQQLGVERVKNPAQMRVSRPNMPRRVCVVGALLVARSYGVISGDDKDRLFSSCSRVVHLRGDWLFELRTVPDIEAVFDVIREADRL